MASDLSATTDIRTEYSKYAQKALCGCYAMQDLGAGMNRWCVVRWDIWGIGHNKRR